MLQEGRTDAPIGRAGFAGSLRGRLLLAALVVSAPLLLGAGLWILLLSHSARDYRQLASEAATESDASVLLLQHLNRAETAGLSYMRTGSQLALWEFQDTAARVDRELADTGRYDEPAEINAFVSIDHPWELAKQHVARNARHAAAQDTFEGHMQIAANGLEQLMAGSQDEVRGELAATERAARLNWLLGLSAVVIALVMAAFLATRLSRSLVRPLEQLAQAARALAAGHLDHRVVIGSPAELQEVGTTFNTMAAAVEDQREELERHAFADSLTGLANRALFEDRTRHALERVAGGPGRVAVLVLDVDGFKLVNDGLGHSCGDAMLKQAAARMATVLRPSDTLARLGSDEFAVLLESVRGLDDTLGAA